MDERKTKKMGNLIREAVEDIIRRDVSDPRIGFFTITFVKVTRDMKYAKILISFLGSDEQKKRGFAGIKSAASYIQHRLAQRLDTRFTPEIVFELDEMKEQRIEQLFSEIRKEQHEPEQKPPD